MSVGGFWHRGSRFSSAGAEAMTSPLNPEIPKSQTPTSHPQKIRNPKPRLRIPRPYTGNSNPAPPPCALRILDQRVRGRGFTGLKVSLCEATLQGYLAHQKAPPLARRGQDMSGQLFPNLDLELERFRGRFSVSSSFIALQSKVERYISL